MEHKRDLKLVVCIANEEAHNNYRNTLHGLKECGKLTTHLPEFAVEMVCVETPEQALESLSNHLASNDNRVGILLFDLPPGLVSYGREAEDGHACRWAKGISPQMRGKCATVAIMRHPRRLMNLDRAIASTVDQQKLLDTLKLLAHRLSYTAPPKKRTPGEVLEIRLIRKQHELLEYFKLRHRIYTIMGYLTQEIENAPSQMEVNWCDTISLHIGAYQGTAVGSKPLVGTARIVVGTEALARERPALLAAYERWVTTLANTDPVLRLELNKVLPFQLPIFQSMNLHGVVRQALRHRQVCGELSRVIVAEDYRGAGLSKRLVQFALIEAAKVGVQRVFLECLDIHEELYDKMGFKRIEGVRGTVISVNQTMIAMELSHPLVVPLPPDPITIQTKNLDEDEDASLH